ncbi:MAG: XRE family transcriptional regulator [Erysipelotrichales bacterium]
MDFLGEKVKILRKKKNLTLQQLSEMTNLSTGYLSQFERGKTTIAIEYLQRIAKAFNVPLEHLIKEELDQSSVDPIVRSYAQETIQIFNHNVYKSLSSNPREMDMLPKIIEMLPQMNRSSESMEEYGHNGEEFVYVLEGILTMHLDNKKYHMYPGDSIHYKSDINHNWENETDRIVKFIAVHTPCDMDLDTLEQIYDEDHY